MGMEMQQYKAEFLSEAQEHLDALNDGLLNLEKDPENEETINRIFRSFHTLKGNSALMGYTRFSELAHALEDLLSQIRNQKLRATRSVIDLMFEGIDRLEQGLQLITDGDPEALETERLLEELHAMLEDESWQAVTLDIGERAELSPEEETTLEKASGTPTRIVIVFDPKNPLKVAKAMLMVRDLKAVGTVVRLTPIEEEIKTGKFDTEIEAVITTDEPKESIEKRLGAIYGVKHAFVMGLEEAYRKPEETVAAEKEHAKSSITQKHHADVVKQVQSVKVDMKRLDKLMNLAGELLISNIRLQDINKKGQTGNLQSISTEIDRLILELQDQVMKIRLVPIGNIFNRFPRMVRDLAEHEGKEVSLQIKGGEIEFDRTVLDQIGEPLVHLLRNSVDHGIETPEERGKRGKDPTGSIVLDVRREKSQAVIEIKDDGQGIDHDKVKANSIKKGLLSEDEAARMTEEQLRLLIFQPGVSTNEVVTEVSGRGVGMDVVLNKVKELGGSLKLDSVIGEGTTITIKLPLTVAILSALLVQSGEHTYAMPLTVVDQIVDIKPEQIKTIQGNQVFLNRGNEIPLFWLDALLGKGSPEMKPTTVLIANKDGQQVGIAVDTILTQQQILIKSLQELVKGTKGLSGATILGDGSVVLILDIDTLV